MNPKPPWRGRIEAMFSRKTGREGQASEAKRFRIGFVFRGDPPPRPVPGQRSTASPARDGNAQRKTPIYRKVNRFFSLKTSSLKIHARHRFISVPGVETSPCPSGISGWAIAKNQINHLAGISSTRRFLAIPAALSLLATGRVEPNPFVDRRSADIPLETM
mgnify:CR=1 FL=1